MSRFSDPALLNGESYAYGLTRVGDTQDSEEFTESTSLDLYIDEEGVANFLGRIFSYEEQDPIDCETVPKFSSGNNFIKGVAQVLPPGVPVGSFFGYVPPLGEKEPPAGYGFCDGSLYELPDGTIWVTPNIPPAAGQANVFIQKLPSGARLSGRVNTIQSSNG